MEIITILGLSVGLGMDALAVATVVGMVLEPMTSRHLFRLSFHFGLFQFLMPVIGWLAGTQLLGLISPWDHWLAFGLLFWIGIRMVRSKEDDSQTSENDPTRGWSLVILSIATSIDALAVGLSLGALGLKIIDPAIVIGITAFIMTLSGMLFGKRIGVAGGRKLEVFGGLILCAIGLKILVQHLFFS